MALALSSGFAVACAVVDPDAESQARAPTQVDAAPDRIRDAAPDLAPPDAGPPVDPVEVELIPSVPFDGSGRARVTFDVPPELRALTLVADGPPEALMVFERLTDGAGRDWISPEPGAVDGADRAALPFPGPFLSPNRAVWGDGVATALVPNNPAVAPAPGRWQAVIAAEPPPIDPTDVYVQIERGRVPAAGRVDLHFHFTETVDWRAANVALDDEFRRMLNVVTVLLRDAGIEPGAVTYTDVPVTAFNISVELELPRLLRLSTHQTGISVFVVGRIEDPAGGPLAGVAGAIPSSGGLPGTGANGVAIARGLADGRTLGATLAHEIGHAMGLFHTVEANPDYGDQLDDTPVGEAGRDNVMYPTAGIEARRFSPQQAEIMRRGRPVDGAP